MPFDLGQHFEYLVFAGAVWLVVAGCAVSSICTQRMDAATRRFWIVLVLLLPPFGLLLYLPFSLDNPKVIKEWINRVFPGREPP